MGKTQETWTVTRWLAPHPWQATALGSIFESMRRMHNAIVKRTQPLLDAMLADPRYAETIANYIEAAKALGKTPQDEQLDKLRKRHASTMNALMGEYGVCEQDLQKFANDLRKQSYQGKLNSDIVQKEATRVYQGVKKIIWGNGKKLACKKRGQQESIEEKKPDTGIIYRADSDTAYILGMECRLEPVKKGDAYLRREMDAIRDGNLKVRYCRIKAVPVGKRIKYQLQMTVKGTPMGKRSAERGCGRLFIDTGMSIMAGYAKTEAYFIVLADGVQRYNEEIAECARRYDALRRAANPGNYNEDGTVRRDTRDFHKRWVHTPAMRDAVIELKNAYRRRTEYIGRKHAEIANVLASMYDEVLVEKIDYAAAMKRAKAMPDVDAAAIDVVDSIAETTSGDIDISSVLEELHSAADEIEGACPEVSKNKLRRRRRFGRSINMRAPAKFLEILKEKVQLRGGSFVEVPARMFALSQLDHVTGEKHKSKLSDRTKIVAVDGVSHRVQRDLYSSFLGYHIVLIDGKPDHVDLDACRADFQNFLARQKVVVAAVAARGDVTGNFGLADFLGGLS